MRSTDKDTNAASPHPGRQSHADLFMALSTVVDEFPGVVGREATVKDLVRSLLPSMVTSLSEQGMEITRGGDGVSLTVAINVAAQERAVDVSFGLLSALREELSNRGLRPVRIDIKVWEMS